MRVCVAALWGVEEGGAQAWGGCSDERDLPQVFCSQGTAGDRAVAGVRPRQASDPPWLRVKGLPGQSTLTPGTWVLRDSGQAARCPAGCVVLG